MSKIFKSDSAYFLGFASIYDKINVSQIKKIIKSFQTLEKFWKSNDSQIHKLKFLTGSLKNDLVKIKKDLDLDKELKYLKTSKIGFINYFEKDYPKALKEITWPPLILFYKGNKEILENPKVAIVGTRKPSYYGIEAAKYFAKGLSSYNITIVSGLALGIDSIAQSEVLKNSGTTIGVLGSGLNNIYPKSNINLVKVFIETGNGLILSEFPPDTPPMRHHFPLRNRIISGLASGVIIIEGNLKSGSLITGNFALEQNREVFAVPGSIFSNRSKGPHFLIKQGAKLVENIEDIMNELKINLQTSKSQNKIISDLTANESKIYNILKDGYEKSVNEIIQESKISSSDVLKCLTILELKNLIKDLGDKIYMIVK